MHLCFLGTAAAEGYPAIFCDCAHCREARALGGRNLRFRSALLVNDNLLIDFGPDLLASAQRFGRNLSQVTTGLVTHAHPDHFHLENFMLRRRSFTGRQPIPTLHLFAPVDVTAALERAVPDLTELCLETTTVRAFESWEYGGYAFQSYQAYHAVDVFDALFYSVSDGRSAFLYACDTGPFPEETWRALEGRSFDAIILEETLGVGDWTQHIGFEAFLNHAKRMRESGMLRPGGRLIAQHMSHTQNPTHEKIEAILNPHGVEVAYDGMEVEL